MSESFVNAQESGRIVDKIFADSVKKLKDQLDACLIIRSSIRILVLKADKYGMSKTETARFEKETDLYIQNAEKNLEDFALSKLEQPRKNLELLRANIVKEIDKLLNS